MKVCSCCGTDKPVSEFYESRGRFKQPCKPCHRRKVREHPKSKRRNRDYNLKRMYGIGLREYEEMLEAQSSVCAICEQPAPQSGPPRTRNLYVDHDHATGAVRQLLCFGCNVALGAFRDNPLLLSRAIEYLARHGGDAA